MKSAFGSGLATVRVMAALVMAGVKMRYVRDVRFCNTYDPFTRKKTKLLSVHVMNLEMRDRAVAALTFNEWNVKLEVMYLGMYSGIRPMPKNMWVKLTKEEQDEKKREKDPCDGCRWLDDPKGCGTRSLSCQAIVDAMNALKGKCGLIKLRYNGRG